MNAIGEELQKKRQDVNLTLEQIAEKTHIKAEYLLDIEHGEFDKLPTIVHAKGFVKIYANFLGLDGLEYSKKLGNANNIHLHEPSLIDSKKNNSRSKFQEIAEDFILILIEKRKKFFTIAIIIISFILAVKLIKFIASPSQKHEAAKEQKLETSLAKSKEEPVVLMENLDLKITALESVWVTVKVDNKLAFEGVLSKNAGEAWSAKEKIEMKIGDAGGVKLFLNGNELTEIGKKGDIVKKLIITKKGVEIS